MASSEEDGTVEEKENNNKKRTKSALATAWLTFYNIAMTAGYVRLFRPCRLLIRKSGKVSRSLKNCKRVLLFIGLRVCPCQAESACSARRI